MFDICAKLGHWPFRPVPGLDELLRRMDRYGIEQAAVSSLSSVFYLNPQDGNDELTRQIAEHRDRLVPFAVLRPNFTGWEDDLARCVDEHGAKGIVLYPNYHHYKLDEPALAPMAELAAAWSLPICVQAGLEDPRRQFDRTIILDVPAEQIGDFATRYPKTTVIALGLKASQPERCGEPLPENFYFDTSNYEALDDLELIVERFGARHILFGTHFPLFNVVANVDKLRLSPMEDSDRQTIGSLNACRLLHL